MFLQEAKEILNNLNKVICHISGPAGAGKTTILNHLKEKYPQFEYIDLDDIEKEATVSLHFENTKRNNYTHKMYHQLHLEKQKILDKYLNNSNRKFVLCGFHDEFPRLYHSKPDDKIHQINYPKNYHLNVHTDNKFFLNISAELSADRFCSRAAGKGRNVSKEDKIKLVSHSKDVLKQFVEMGYKPMTYDSIMKWFDSKFSNKKLNESTIPKNFRQKSEVYIIDGNKIYVARFKDPNASTFCTLPGGGIDPGESPEDAVRRECMEEIGVTIKDLKPIDKLFCFSFDKNPMFMGTYDGMCVYSFIAKFDKKVNNGIENHLKLDIITIDEMIKICTLGLTRYNAKWWSKMVQHRIDVLNKIKGLKDVSTRS